MINVVKRRAGHWRSTAGREVDGVFELPYAHFLGQLSAGAFKG
jgi:hypothetical protein